MAREFGGKVGFRVENYGDSPLAKKFGLANAGDRLDAPWLDGVAACTPLN